MPDRAAAALALASAAFVSVPVGLIPQHAKAQYGARRRRETGAFWEVVKGASVSDSHFRGILVGGVTWQQPLGVQSTWGIHGEIGTSLGENSNDDIDNAFSAQVALFTRNPTLGEIGLVAGLTTFSDDQKPTTTSFALEGEYYLNRRITLGAAIGVQKDDHDHDDESYWVAQGGVSVYPTDNLKFTLSGLVMEHGAAGGSIGVEYKPQNGLFNTDTVWFAKASTSEQATVIRAGLRLAWGGGGSGQSLLYADRYLRKNFYGSMLGTQGVSPVDNAPNK